MKRQHPDNPELFWCPKCQGYKARREFGERKASKDNVDWYCKPCNCRRSMDVYLSSDKGLRNARERERRKTRQEYLAAMKAWRKRNPEKHNAARKKIKAKSISELKDRYLTEIMRRGGLSITPETIELKRQQITMKRTLKEFKQWRGENESNHTDVSGKQHTDETDYERRREDGRDCINAA